MYMRRPLKLGKFKTSFLNFLWPSQNICTLCTYVCRYVYFNCKAVYCAHCQKLIEWNTSGPHESLRIFLHERVFLTAEPFAMGPKLF